MEILKQNLKNLKVLLSKMKLWICEVVGKNNCWLKKYLINFCLLKNDSKHLLIEKRLEILHVLKK
jgi:hypothetical protein